MPEPYQTDVVDIFNQHRPRLFAIAYRMLGTVMDAEDILQEAFLRWQNATEKDVQSPSAYLTTIVIRLCIDHLGSAQVRRETYPGPWLPEPYLEDRTAVTDPVVLAESLSTAFLVLLESLSPVERAVFLLREVFGYEYDEIARFIDKSEANCRKIFSRARRYIHERRPRFDAAPRQHQELALQFVETISQGDLEGLLELLAEDITLYSDGGGKVPAAARPIFGAERVAQFLLGLRRLAPPDLKMRLARVNSQPGILIFAGRDPLNVFTLDIQSGQIQTIFVVVNPDKLRKLPDPEDLH